MLPSQTRFLKRFNAPILHRVHDSVFFSLLDACQDLRLGKVPVAVIDSLALAAVDGYQLLRKEVKISAQQDGLPTDVSYSGYRTPYGPKGFY